MTCSHDHSAQWLARLPCDLSPSPGCGFDSPLRSVAPLCLSGGRSLSLPRGLSDGYRGGSAWSGPSDSLAKARLLPSAIVAAKVAGLGKKIPNGHNGELGGSREGALTDESGGLLGHQANPLGNFLLKKNVFFRPTTPFRRPTQCRVPGRLTPSPGIEPGPPGRESRSLAARPTYFRYGCNT